eukprot:518037_1
MRCINQLQDVHCNGFNNQIDCSSLSTNTPLYNNNPMSQKAFLNIIPKKRRSRRLQLKAQKQNSQQIKNDINKNILVKEILKTPKQIVLVVAVHKSIQKP